MNKSADNPQPAGAPPALPPEIDRQAFLQVYFAVIAPMFLAAIDQTLLAAAIPMIAREFGDLQNSPWVATAYLMAAATVVTVCGRLGDKLGRRRVMLGSLAVLSAGACLCAAAPSLPWLIAGRVLQGLGGGGLMSLSMALIGEFVPPRQRARFQGYFSALFTGAHVCGPMIGGLVVAHVSWRWLFVGYLPLVLVAAWRLSLLPAREGHRDAPGMRDAPGLILFSGGILALLYGLSSAGLRFAWLSWQTPFWLLLAGFLWWLLYRHARNHPAPFFPIELLRITAIRRISFSTMCSTFCMLSLLYYVPIYLQLAMNVGVGRAGVLVAPVMAGMVCGGILTGLIVARTGRPQPLPVWGLSFATVALLVLSVAPASVPVVVTVGLFCGLGIGPTMPTSQLIIQAVTGPERLGAGTSVVSLARTLGAALGTAVTGAVIYSLLPGVDVKALGNAAAIPEGVDVVGAFHTAFFVVACVAALGAFNASRVPRIKL